MFNMTTTQKLTVLLVISSLFLCVFISPSNTHAFTIFSPLPGALVCSSRLSVNGMVDEPGTIIVDITPKGNFDLKLSSKSLYLKDTLFFIVDFLPEDLRAKSSETLNLWLIIQFLPDDKSKIPPFPIFREFTWEITTQSALEPAINAFVNPSSIEKGKSATLSWLSSLTTSITVSPSIGIDPLPLTGTATISPTSTTTYLFIATGPGGTAEARVTLTVTEPAPLPAITVSVTPSSIERGQSTRLNWSSVNTTSLSVSPSIGIDPLPLSGTATISPTSTTTYLFTASGPGGTATASVTLTVTAPPPPPPPPPLYRTVELRTGSTIYKVDGSIMIMDAAPYIEEGRTMVPVRFLVEGLGGTVGWDNATKTVTVRFTKPVLEIKLIIGNPTATVNNIKVPIDSNNPKVVPVININRTFVPLRFLVEQITGSLIEWIPPDTVIMKLPK